MLTATEDLLIFEPDLQQEAVEKFGILTFQIYLPMTEIFHAHLLDDPAKFPYIQQGMKCLCVSAIRPNHAKGAKVYYFLLQQDAADQLGEKVRIWLSKLPLDQRRLELQHLHHPLEHQHLTTKESPYGTLPKLKQESAILKESHIAEVQANPPR